jgi:AraC-like DNA-binding protein
MDALSAILESVKLKAVVYQKLVMYNNWGLDMPQDNNSQFWRLLKGSCFLKVPGQDLLELNEGDLILVPHGAAHWIADHADSPRLPTPEFIKARQNGTHMFSGGGNETVLVGGHFEFSSNPVHPFIKDLPKVIHITNLKSDERSWLQETANLIFEEISNERPGSKIIAARLAEIVFINTIRAYLEQNKDTIGFLSALNDKRISKALKVMQESPGIEWSLDSLSKEAGMSRTLFCNKFKQLVGETPLSYLTNWRITKAKDILAVSKENISEVAMQVGYQSEAAFNRIFKAKVNKTPANYRRELLSR